MELKQTDDQNVTLPSQLRYKDFDFGYIQQLAAQNGHTYVESNKNTRGINIYDNKYTHTTEFQKLSFAVDGLPCEYFTAFYSPLIIDKQASFLAPNLAESAAKTPMGQFQVQVFVVTLPFEVEDLYVESKTNMTLNNILGLSTVVFHDTKRVQLEGDFNSFFRVYVPEGEEINAFTILAPNVMLNMLKNAGNYDFEFSGNKVFFYRTFSYFEGGRINLSKKDYENLLAFGMGAARSMARAGRPAKVTENNNTKMWELYGTKNTASYFAMVALTLLSVLLVFLCFVIPLLWPVAIILLIVFAFKYLRLKSKRRKLLASYGDI